MSYQAYLVPAFILLCCAPAFFVDSRLINSVFILSGISLALGTLARAWPYMMPPNFLLEHPALADTPLHPATASVLGGVLILFGVGLLLALGSRALWHYFHGSRR
jgi:hypothetical protein